MANLRTLREKAGLSRQALANKAGLSFTTIRAHELGKSKSTRQYTARALAAVLGVKVQALFFTPDSK